MKELDEVIQGKLDILQKRHDILNTRSSIRTQKDTILIEKVKSLIWVLEATEPREGFQETEDVAITGSERDAVIQKLMELIKKY